MKSIVKRKKIALTDAFFAAKTTRRLGEGHMASGPFQFPQESHLLCGRILYYSKSC